MVQPVAWPVILSFHSLSPDDRAADTLPSLVLYCAPSWPLKAILYSSSAFYVPVGPKIHPSTHSYFLLVLLLDNTKLSKDDQVPGFLNLNSLRPSQKYYFKTLKTKGPGGGWTSQRSDEAQIFDQPHAPHHLSSTKGLSFRSSTAIHLEALCLGVIVFSIHELSLRLLLFWSQLFLLSTSQQSPSNILPNSSFFHNKCLLMI